MNKSFNEKCFALNDPDSFFNSKQLAFKRNDLIFRNIIKLHFNAWLEHKLST